MKRPFFFRCKHCDFRLKASADSSGEFANCPQCQGRIEIPEPEGGPVLYEIEDEPSEPSSPETGIAAGPAVPAAPASKPKLATTDIWHPPENANVPPPLRSALNQAQALGGTGQEISALALLLQAGRDQLFEPRNRPLWKPSALCLVRWAQKMLDWLQDEELDLSGPLQDLLQRAGENQRWGGTFTFRNCTLCDGSLEGLRGYPQVKTAAGVASLCCAAPVEDDFALVGLIDTLWQALMLARMLDSDNPEVQPTLDALPAWHKVLLTPDTRSYWCRVIGGQGQLKLRDLTPEAIEQWLADRGVSSEALLMRDFLRLVQGRKRGR